MIFSQESFFPWCAGIAVFVSILLIWSSQTSSYRQPTYWQKLRFGLGLGIPLTSAIFVGFSLVFSSPWEDVPAYELVFWYLYALNNVLVGLLTSFFELSLRPIHGSFSRQTTRFHASIFLLITGSLWLFLWLTNFLETEGTEMYGWILFAETIASALGLLFMWSGKSKR